MSAEGLRLLKELTDRTVKSEAKKPVPEGCRRLVMDTQVRAFGLMVTDQGAASYIVTLRFPGAKSTSRRRLGTVGEMSLADAREKAKEWKKLVKLGLDPDAEEERVRRENARKRVNTFDAVAEHFIAALPADERKRDEVARDVRRHLVAEWGSRPAGEVEPRDVAALVRKLKPTPYQARNTFGYCNRLFNWAIAQLDLNFGVSVNPCTPVDVDQILGGPKKARDRFLLSPEIRAFWKATEEFGYPYGPIYQLLLLTGARLNEIAQARWAEVDEVEQTLTIPKERYKTERDTIIPLCADAVAILQGLPRVEGGEFIFSTDGGRKPVNGFSKPKVRLDAAMTELLGKAPADWINHDLRRTVRTNMSQIPEVPPHIAELVAGHSLTGIVKVYDRYSYLPEKREALRLWEARLRTILASPSRKGDNVILWKDAAAAVA